MLQRILIRDFALIETLDLEFSKGFNAITGESGHGKSLVLDAISALFGGKLSTAQIRTGKDKIFLQAEVSLGEGSPLKTLLAELGYSSGEENLILTRELQRDGRPRIKIGDSLGSLLHLREIGKYFVEIHTQNEQLVLLEKKHQMEYLDRFAKITKDSFDFKTFYQEYLQTKREVEQHQRDEALRNTRMEWLRHQIHDLEQLSPKSHQEEEELLQEERFLSQGEKVSEFMKQALELLGNSSEGILRSLQSLEVLVEKIMQSNPKEKDLLGTLLDSKESLVFLRDQLRNDSDEIYYSPERLDLVQARLQEFQRIRKKLGDGDLSDLARDLCSELSDLEKQEAFQNSKVILEQKKLDLKKRALALSKKRRESIPKFEEALQKEMQELGLEGSKLQAVLRWEEDPNGDYTDGNHSFLVGELGLDSVEFYFSANPGEKPRPLRKVASGGELSRVMLALRSTLENLGEKVLIFDEIDTGLGGESAVSMGRKLANLSKSGQVLLVTHTQQVAAQAGRHFMARKRTDAGRTVAEICLLEGSDRDKELARMIGGRAYSASALAAARDLLKRKAS